MKFEELTVLLPCHSLEDFPLYHEGDEAEGLLAAWTALWHPALLAEVGKIPVWHRADSPPHNPRRHLIAVPEVAEASLPAGFAIEAAEDGARLLPRLGRRADLVAAALAELEDKTRDVSAELVADFFALGSAYLQVALLTRRMRYSSTLDEAAFQQAALTAATAALRRDDVAAREHLSQCFKALAEARQHFYPVDTYLLDWTLIAPTTIGSELRTDLTNGQTLNLFVSAATIEQIATREPETLTALRRALELGTMSLVGGEYEERDLPLVTLEEIRSDLQDGVKEYQRHLGVRPIVFGRRRFGLTPALPQILRKCGFEAAIHVTLDDGRMPQPDRSKLLWEGLDGTAIDALGRVPLDASDPGNFWKLTEWLGTTMDLDHVATVSFAHWPGMVSSWYEDVRRMTAYAPVLGRFVTLENYFKNTEAPTARTRFIPDEYRSPYLVQAVAQRRADPISRYVRCHQRRAVADAAQALATLASVVRGDPAVSPAIDLPDEVERRHTADETAEVEFDKHLAAGLNDAARDLAAVLPRESAGPPGYLVCNPLSSTCQIEIDTSELPALPIVEGSVLGADESGGQKRVLVEVPPMGFAWIGPKADVSPAKASRKGRRSVASDYRLHNEWFEVVIHPKTGGIQAIHDVGRRGNRLSQQIAMRMPDEWNEPNAQSVASDAWHDVEEGAIYSAMVADTIAVTVNGPYLGEITSQGRLLDPAGRRLAGFQQTVRLWYPSRIIRVNIELDSAVEPSGSPWNSYFAARFAWADESIELRRSVHGTFQSTDAARIEASHFIELASDTRRTSILTGGLPFHRRVGFRKLDSLLVVRGETARRFRFAIGVDLPNAPAAGQEFLVPPTTIPRIAPPGAVRSGWLFHVQGNSVAATNWEPLVVGGQMVGIRVRLLETSGRPTRTTLRTFRPPVCARLLDFENRSQGDLHVEADQVKLDFAAYEWLQVEARWS